MTLVISDLILTVRLFSRSPSYLACLQQNDHNESYIVFRNDLMLFVSDYYCLGSVLVQVEHMKIMLLMVTMVPSKLDLLNQL